MTFKKIATSVGLILAATASSAYADMNSQLASLQAQVNQLQSQVNAGGSSMGGASNMFGTNSMLSSQMMGNYNGVGKEMNLLKAKSGLSNVTLGGYAQADAMWDNTNTQGAFVNPVMAASGLSGSGSTSKNSTSLQLSNANLAATASMGKWVTGYMQVGQSILGSNYSVNAAAATTTSFGIQDAYLVFGNLNAAPVYGFVGYKDIDFGSFATVDMYNQPLTRTYFQATGNTAGVGYSGYGFNVVASAINGGSQNSVVNVNSSVQTQNMYTSNNNTINNFAVNTSYGMTNSGVAWNVGVGYLNGGAFAKYSTTNSSGTTNGVWDANGKVSYMGFDLMGEFDYTANKTNYTTTVSAQKHAQAWDIGADYNFPVMGYKTAVDAEYSQFVGASDQTTAGSTANYDKSAQYVLGYRVQPVKNVWTGLEYAYQKGVPTAVTSSGSISNISNNTLTLDVTAMF